jgi:RNA polymerase sigma-70 factor (ECF subfamily)
VSVDPVDDLAASFLDLYDRALPEVYGYLLHRCGDVSLVEDLTSESFVAAVRSARRDQRVELTTAWLIAVARHKLIDHWRRRAREERGLRRLMAGPGIEEAEGLGALEEGLAMETLRRLPEQYRAALTVRYVDGLSVPETATVLGRTLHATESLLARARGTFRRLYLEGDDD